MGNGLDITKHTNFKRQIMSKRCAGSTTQMSPNGRNRNSQKGCKRIYGEKESQMIKLSNVKLAVYVGAPLHYYELTSISKTHKEWRRGSVLKKGDVSIA